ncbi:thiamine pyrophosphokinase-related protein [Colletotrichum camelliae]|nr:thiamine pyrophosphokinase-related protein [Colletotrichum camelliae]
MSTTENYRYKNLVELVKDVNRFQIRGTEWRFCLKDPTDPASPWKAFGVVLEENVKWLKKANSKWLEFDWMSKQIRLINPPTDPTTGTIQLNVAWKEIIDKLDEIQCCNLPQWVKKDTKWLYNDKESWPLIDEDENFRKLFRQGIWCDLVPIFGIVTTGAHLNVYKLTEEKGYEIWVSRRPDTQPNFPGLLDQAAAGGFTPSRRTILECIEKEKKEESKGYPQNWRELMHRSPDIPTIQFLDLRDWRWEKGYAGLPEPGIRKAYDLRVNNENICGKEGQTFKLMGIDEIRESMLHGRWKPNSALVMIDFMIRHGLIENETEKAEITRLLKLDRGRRFGLGITATELSDYVQFPLHSNQ